MLIKAKYRLVATKISKGNILRIKYSSSFIVHSKWGFPVRKVNFKKKYYYIECIEEKITNKTNQLRVLKKKTLT